MANTIVSLDALFSKQVFDDGAKSKPQEAVKTLESLHTQQLSKLRDEKSNVKDLKRELAEKRARLDAIERESDGPSLTPSASDIILLSTRSRLESEIRVLEENIRSIESGTKEADYFLRVGDILFSYSDAQERIAGGEKTFDSPGVKKGRIPTNSVFSYFSQDSTATAVAAAATAAAAAAAAREEPNVAMPPQPVTAAASSSEVVKLDAPVRSASVLTNDLGFRRDKAYEAYLSALNPDSIQHENSIASSITVDFGTCVVCDSEMLMNETFLDCPECGYRDVILVDSEKPSYKDPPREMSYYAYKKINHLNEWLAQFQAKESTEISNAVLDQIRAELRKEHITDMSKVKPSKLKDVIKKLKLNRCYDHVAHILNRLNGISAPVLSREIEEKLRFMFKEIQFSFVKHCPKKRSNFLSYSFVLYKFCELLELDDYLPCFPLLKSREKLYMQDKIWQKICEDMGWEFIRTV